MKEALRPFRNRKTVEKIVQNRKTGKKDSIKTENRMQNCQNRYIFISQSVLTSAAYRVNYTYFITVFMNAMNLAFASSSICLN